MRLVVCSSGGWQAPWGLPASVPSDRRIVGGDRTMCELAVAAAGSGVDVELRGDFHPGLVEELSRAAGGASPRVGMGPRPATADDFVVVPDGWDPLSFARVALSPARKAILLMAPAGMFGWPFVERWEQPDPVVVSRYDVGRAEHYQAMRGMGFELWTLAPAVAEATRTAGVECRWIGNGTPVPFPDPPPKRVDVVYGLNRWTPFAEAALDGLNVTSAMLPEVDQPTYLRMLGEARIFLLPMWMTGMARVFNEARAMGTPALTLRIERFPTLLDDMKGTVVADRVEEIPKLITDLLADPARLDTMSREAGDSARDELSWDRYVGRVHEAVLSPPPADDTAEARAGLGRGIAGMIEELPAEADLRVAEAAERHAAFRRRRSVRAAAAITGLLGRLRPRR